MASNNRTVQGIPAQTDKQVVPLNLRLTDLSGGQNSYTNPSLIEAKEARISSGVSYRQKGTVRVQRGRVKRYMTTIANYTTGGLGAYYKRNSKSYFIMVIGSTVYYDRALLNFLYTSAADFQTGTRNSVGAVDAIRWDNDYLAVTNAWKACLLAFLSGEPYPYVPITAGTGITVGYSLTPKQDIVVSSITMGSAHAGISTTEHLFKISVWEYSTKARLASATGTAYSWNHPKGETPFIARLDPPLALKANTEYIISCYTVSGEMYEWNVDWNNTTNAEHFTWTATHNMSSAGDVFPETVSRGNKYLRGLFLQEYDLTGVSLAYNTDAELNTGTYTNSVLSSGKAVVTSLVSTPIPVVYTGEELINTSRYDTNKVKLVTDRSYWLEYSELTWQKLIDLTL